MWQNPLGNIKLVPTVWANSFIDMNEGYTGLPMGDHPGAFGVKRKHHTHEGIDLYCPEGSPVYAVEDGNVVNCTIFTGPEANPPSPWWQPTQALFVQGRTGVVVYGEISTSLEIGTEVKAGDLLGHVVQVLTTDKGRPMSMLHLELHEHGTTEAYDWVDEKPETLLNPTPYILDAAERNPL